MAEMTPSDRAQRLRALAQRCRIDAIGFAPTSTFHGAPAGKRPEDYLPSAVSVISIGYHLNHGPIQNLPKSRSAYMLEHDYANRHLAACAQRVVRRLEAEGNEAVGFDAGAGFYTRFADTPHGLAGDFSHKHTAYACGLGSFGVNNLILTANYGPRIRFTSILTSAELPAARAPRVTLCRSPACDACVQLCPVGALDAWNDGYSASEGWVIAKRKCYAYIFDTLGGQRCGLCIKACPVGLARSVAATCR